MSDYRGSLVRFLATPGTLVVLGQKQFIQYIASVYPAAKWVPSINKAMLRVCALYAASCSGISPGGLRWFLYIQCLLGEEGRVSTSVDTRLIINRIPLSKKHADSFSTENIIMNNTYIM